MTFPNDRPRRLRRNPGMRALARETVLRVEDLILPLFVRSGVDTPEPVESMPGVVRHSLNSVVDAAAEAAGLGIPAVLLFGVGEPKSVAGEAAWDEAGVVPEAVRRIKKTHPALVVITDVCLCAYTEDGHCGLTRSGRIENDLTLEPLSRMALSHARAGADVVAPSDMMDGRVGAIRSLLDQDGQTETAILSYAVKYASAYYGPFRDAADSAPASGDRRTHQMDPANLREALREARLDMEEGADLLMVKPALAYLDVIRAVSDVSDRPVVAYNVSGEYAMVKAAAERGWIDEPAVVLETLMAMRRAGADSIITYHATDAARWLRAGS